MAFAIGFASKFCIQPIFIVVILVSFIVFVTWAMLNHIFLVQMAAKWLHMDANSCTQMQMEGIPKVQCAG